MAELVDALDSKSSSFGSVGSIPTSSTKKTKTKVLVFLLKTSWVPSFSGNNYCAVIFDEDPIIEAPS